MEAWKPMHKLIVLASRLTLAFQHPSSPSPRRPAAPPRSGQRPSHAQSEYPSRAPQYATQCARFDRSKAKQQLNLLRSNELELALRGSAERALRLHQWIGPVRWFHITGRSNTPSKQKDSRAERKESVAQGTSRRSGPTERKTST